MWRKGNPFAMFLGMQIGGDTVESSMEILQKIKKGTALWLSGSTSGNLSEETQNTNSKVHEHPYVHWSIYNCQDLEIAQVYISRRLLKQIWDIYAMECYSAVKKKKSLPFVTVWVDLENIMLSEISQSEKDKYHMTSHICGI